MRYICRIWTWDEIDQEMNRMVNHDGEDEFDNLLPEILDDHLIFSLRKLYHDDGAEEDPDEDEPGWTVVGVSRTKQTATVEWTSERGHLCVTTVIWEPCP